MKTVIEIAREAGFMVVHEGDAKTGAWYECFTDEIERFAELVRADEREACAKLCDARAAEYDGFSAEQNASEKLAESIRARGNK